jgi:hypothetical protein
MSNVEFLKFLEYQERVYRELHGVKAARKHTEALEHARYLVAREADWGNGRALGEAPEVEAGRDGWY